MYYKTEVVKDNYAILDHFVHKTVELYKIDSDCTVIVLTLAKICEN